MTTARRRTSNSINIVLTDGYYRRVEPNQRPLSTLSTVQCPVSGVRRQQRRPIHAHLTAMIRATNATREINDQWRHCDVVDVMLPENYGSDITSSTRMSAVRYSSAFLIIIPVYIL